jgi:hypothetical protein
MPRKPFSKSGISRLPADKPVVYTLETAAGNPNYVGSAKKGRVRERLAEHLPSGPDPVPARSVSIKQYPSIRDARAAEKKAIGSQQPKHNKRHK